MLGIQMIGINYKTKAPNIHISESHYNIIILIINDTSLGCMCHYVHKLLVSNVCVSH